MRPLYGFEGREAVRMRRRGLAAWASVLLGLVGSEGSCFNDSHHHT